MWRFSNIHSIHKVVQCKYSLTYIEVEGTFTCIIFTRSLSCLNSILYNMGSPIVQFRRIKGLLPSLNLLILNKVYYEKGLSVLILFLGICFSVSLLTFSINWWSPTSSIPIKIVLLCFLILQLNSWTYFEFSALLSWCLAPRS